MSRNLTRTLVQRCIKSRYFSSYQPLTNEHSDIIKIVLKDGEVISIPDVDANKNLNDKIHDTIPSYGKTKNVRGRIKPKQARIRRRRNDLMEYHDDKLNNEAYKKIINEQIQDISLKMTINRSGIKQETVHPNMCDKGNSTKEQINPPQLSGELHRVLYQPMTLHQLKDSRSNMYLFDPRLERITPEFLQKEVPKLQDKNDKNTGTGNVPLFLTPHKDKNLMKVAKMFKKKYISSSSSMTSILSHMHFLLSNFRGLNINDTPISQSFNHSRCKFSRGAKFPAMVILRKKNDKIRSIDSDKTFDKEMVLSILGHSLERFLTENPDLPESENDFYHYSKISDFIVRSQLDAYDPHLPGTGVFDLKTRAVCAIRHDLSYIENNNNSTGYRLDKIHGEYESFEREFYELIKATLLKYSLQSRIGKMDGIFVAYHNISKLFGFQYLPQEELDYIIHSKMSDKFVKELKRRNDNVIKSVGHKNYIVNHLFQDREVANRVAELEFQNSFVILKNTLEYLETEINKKLGNNEWEMCKIMMQTTERKLKLSNNENVTYPVLNIIAVPLPSNYKDKSIIEPDTTQENIKKVIEEYSSKIERDVSDEKFLDKMVGVQVRVFHKQSATVEQISKNMGRIESSATSDKLIADPYYSKQWSFQTPNFLHPDDVNLWKVGTWWTPINDPRRLGDLYKQYCSIKLDTMRNQLDIVGVETESVKEGSVDEQKKEKNEGLNVFKTILRAYGEKGTKDEGRERTTGKKKMWNSKTYANTQ